MGHVGPCKRCGLPISLHEEGTRFQAKCAGNPACQFLIMFPSGVSSVLVLDATCRNCTHGEVHFVRLGFRMASLPTNIQRLLQGPVHECCILCDHVIDQMLLSSGPTREIRGRAGMQITSASWNGCKLSSPNPTTFRERWWKFGRITVHWPNEYSSRCSIS